MQHENTHKGDRKSEGTWDETWDVVIVGSGFAGLAAAIEAREAGRSVLVLEKMLGWGGNSTICDGGLAAPNTDMQRERGIQDSPAQMAADMLAAGLGLSHPALVRIVADHALEVFEWTRNTLKVRYMDRVDRFGGHSVDRCYTTHNKSGSAIVRGLLDKAKELGVALQNRTLLEHLVLDAQGRVRGADVRQGYHYPEEGSGLPKRIRVRRAVVMAAGGFGGDVQFRSAQDPRLDASVDVTTKRSATAEALREVLRVGALPAHLSWIQLAPWASPDEKGYGIGPDFACYIALPQGIVVSPLTGRRIVNELGDRRVRAEGIFREGTPCIALADHEGVVRSGYSVEKCLKKGIVRAFDTLDVLARHHHIPSGPLAETVERFNAQLRAGEDIDFGKPIRESSGPLETPPFYAIRLWPKVHYTMGGALINEQAQVLDLQRKPIPGLYAAGEFAAGVQGACRLGSCSITDCLVFGRIAGRQAAAEPNAMA
ncbi:MAG: flavocytochrome c [Desulfatiglandaceae bacterium]